MSTEQNKEPIPVLVADAATFALDALDGIRVIGIRPELGDGALSSRLELAGALKAGGGKLSDEVRKELITRIRGGEHVELEFSAITYRQKDGFPNRNGLRFKPSKLAKIARSWKNKPALVDHRSWAQGARIGTLVDSELVELGDGWVGFRQTFRVVKPEAVISVLDGTIDRFSIGWAATGPVHCTIHGGPVFEACRCWPLDQLEIDGELKIAEYEFTSAEGDETSAVNTPAVSGTKIEDVRAALAASLKQTHERPDPMAFPRLAAVLSLAALTETDDERAASSVEEIKRGKLAAEAERDTYKARALAAEGSLAKADEERKAAEAKLTAREVDTVIESAYTAGKLIAKRDAAGARIPSKLEEGLRKIGTSLGLEPLKAHVEDLPVVVPLGQRRDELAAAEVADNAPSSIPSPVLASVSAQLGLDAKEVAQNAALAAGGRRTVVPFIHTVGARLTSADKEG